MGDRGEDGDGAGDTSEGKQLESIPPHCSARSEARARGRYQLDGMGYKRQEMLPFPLIFCLPVSMMRV